MVMKCLSTQVPTGVFIFLKSPCCFQTVAGNLSGQSCRLSVAWRYHIPFLSGVWLLPRWFFLGSEEQVASVMGPPDFSACFHFHSPGKALPMLVPSFYDQNTFLENSILESGVQTLETCSAEPGLLVTSALRQ